MSVSSAFIYMTFKRRDIFQLCFHFTASYLNICNILSSGTDFFYEILSHFFTVKLNKDVFWYLSAAYFDDPRWWVSLFCFLCCASFCRSWLKKLAAWGTAKPSEFNYKSSLLPAADPSFALWLSFPHCYCLDTSFLDYTGSATTCVLDSYWPCHMLMHVLHYWLADRHIHLNYVL